MRRKNISHKNAGIKLLMQEGGWFVERKQKKSVEVNVMGIVRVRGR